MGFSSSRLAIEKSAIQFKLLFSCREKWVHTTPSRGDINLQRKVLPSNLNDKFEMEHLIFGKCISTTAEGF